MVNVFNKIWKYLEQKVTSDGIWKSFEEKPLFGNDNNEIKDYNKIRFNSNIDLPLNTIIEFRALILNICCVIKKDDKYYPEIYLDEGFYVHL